MGIKTRLIGSDQSIAVPRTMEGSVQKSTQHKVKVPPKKDAYLAVETPNPSIGRFGKHAIARAKELWGKQVEADKVPWPTWEAIALEKEFIKNPNFLDFLRVVHDFNNTMPIVGHEKYAWLNQIIIPLNVSSSGNAILSDDPHIKEKSILLEAWHEKNKADYERMESDIKNKVAKRHEAIAKKGPGYPGKMTDNIRKAKEVSYFAKNNLTMRGNVFKLTHKACPKNIFEIMPRFGYRKTAHIAVRVPQFMLNGAVVTLGYVLIPLTFGLSKYISNHLSNAIYIGGETLALKIAGASNKKLATHASLRAAQLETMRAIPVAGDIIYYGENVAFGSAALGIVASTVADAVMKKTSVRYTSTINLDDVGDSSCLYQLNQRIDYLSRFLLPYGQYLLFKESNIENRMKLKKILKAQFKTLRKLEKDKIRSLNYYLLALLAEEIPKTVREKIRIDCQMALPETRINTHRIVRSCLARLLKQEPSLHRLKTAA